ncbi:MAG TPA: hypothetical protein VGD13_08370 [Xanthobacteraceae bacterium]
MSTATSEVPGESAPAAPPTAFSIRKVLFGESFIEKAILLLLTALITGMAVPLTITWINAHETRRQQIINEAKARNEALLAAQSKLLEDFSETIFIVQTLALDVSWHGSPAYENKEMQKKAYDRYSDQIIGHISRWRAQIARARILASQEVAKKMRDYFEIMFLQDAEIVQLYNRQANSTEWQSRHAKSETMLDTADNLLAELARDMGISRAAVRLTADRR